MRALLLTLAATVATPEAAEADEATASTRHHAAAEAAYAEHDYQRLARECEVAVLDWRRARVEGDAMREILDWCANGLRRNGRLDEAVRYHLHLVALERNLTDREAIEARAEPWAVAALAERRMAEGLFVDVEQLLNAALAVNPSLADYRIERRRDSASWGRAYPVAELACALAVEHGLPSSYRAIVDGERRHSASLKRYSAVLVPLSILTSGLAAGLFYASTRPTRSTDLFSSGIFVEAGAFATVATLGLAVLDVITLVQSARRAAIADRLERDVRAGIGLAPP